ncbi:MAG: UDP-N-acetylmuramoyl-tripeptide--D-alanyl-D-alanine ligase [Nocardioides sp.]
MIPTLLADVARANGGTLADVPDPGAVVTDAVVVDSRQVEPGGLFVAVRGERVDGHDHAADAVAAGALACLAARPLGVPAVVVEDTVAALGRLAADMAGRLEGCIVVGVTGSQGKTSTKDLLAQVLELAGPTVAPLGSFNNEIGVPLTVLRANADTAFLVVEMGARGRGHVRFLSDMVSPTIGCVLNVGSAHLGEFGSQEAIAASKGELVEALPPAGTAVLNADDPAVAAMASRTRARVLTFGESPQADVRVEHLRTSPDGCAAFDLVSDGQRTSVTLRLLGEHQAMNAAAAAGVALAAGLTLADVAAALSAAVPRSRWRMERTERSDGVLVVNDAYNANPDSMRAALKTLVGLSRARGGRSFAVLGQMRELGEESTSAHDAVGRLAVRLDVDQLVVVGEAAATLHLGACLEGSWGQESVLVPDTDAAVALLRELLRPGDTVLVKASRDVGLERVAQALLADVPAAAPSGQEDSR